MLKPVALLTPRPSPSRDLTLPDWLLASKLEPPLPRAGAVVRGGLLAVLDQAQARPLTLLLAPPGFGKSTLLTQWHAQLLAREPAAVAWLSLDEEDAEPARFLGLLALALQGAGADPALCAPALHGRDHDPRDALNALIRALRAAPRRISVILDDYDRPGGSAIDELVLRLIEHAGGRLHLLLSTRRVPGLPLARLELQAQLTRVGSTQLALDEDEAQALLGAQVAAPVVDELRRYTEGWPVALHLARLWLEGGAQRQQEVATRFSGRNAQIAAYLAEQVVNDLDADTRDLLLRTSPLERLNAALADAVRQRDDSGRLLAGLEHFHGLLIPLDGEREWFRYHPLFADFLQQLLDREHPAGALQIHQRAARWFGEHQYLSDAVRHASRGECGDLAASYVARAGTWQLLLTHGTHQVRALLRHFDHRTIRDTPALNLTQAHLHMKLGEFSHARLLLERFRDFPAALREPLQRDYTVVVAALRERLDEICGNPHGLTQIAGQAAALDEDDHLGRGMLLCICATTALAQGASRWPSAMRMARARPWDAAAASSAPAMRYWCWDRVFSIAAGWAMPRRAISRHSTAACMRRSQTASCRPPRTACWRNCITNAGTTTMPPTCCIRRWTFWSSTTAAPTYWPPATTPRWGWSACAITVVAARPLCWNTWSRSPTGASSRACPNWPPPGA